MLTWLYHDAKEDEYVEKLVRYSQYLDRDGDGLDLADIEESEAIEVAKERTHGLSRLMSNDIDGDGVVTGEEAERTAIHENPLGRNKEWQAQVTSQAYYEVLRFDDDGDRKVTIAEFYKRTEGEVFPMQGDQYRAMLQMDPDHDGKLTSSEVEAIARRSLEIADADHDGVFSDGEFQDLSGPRAAAQKDMQIGICSMEKAKPDDLLVHVYDYAARRQPDVTVAGQYGETKLAVMKIEEGEQSIHLILYSYNPTIWQFEGAVGRLSHVTVIPGLLVCPGTKAPGAGTIGLPADKVEFLAPWSCALAGYGYSDGEGKEAHDRAIERAFLRGPGRQPDVSIGGDYQANPVITFVPLAEDFPSTPQAAEDEPGKQLREEEDRRTNPREIVSIDPSEVLAPGKVERYGVLPSLFGVRQLVEQGKLERTDQGYRILEPITQFPAGLEGMKFILPEGIEIPSGQWMYPTILPQRID
jgi:hypothetical protein